MKLSEFLKLSTEERKEYCIKVLPPHTNVNTHEVKRRLEGPVPCISCLYSNYCFWSGSKSKLTITLDENCIFDGQLRQLEDQSDDVECEMKWKGYFSQVYDGYLYMTPLTDQAYIEGTAEKKTFAFDGVVPRENSIWPGFLDLFEPTR